MAAQEQEQEQEQDELMGAQPQEAGAGRGYKDVA